MQLNVGGQTFCTRLSTLLSHPDSVLAKIFDERFGTPMLDDSGVVFLDSDPSSFEFILQYLRRGQLTVIAGLPRSSVCKVRDDAEYYGLLQLVEACEKVLGEGTTLEKHNIRMAEAVEGIHEMTEFVEDIAMKLGNVEGIVEKLGDIWDHMKDSEENLGEKLNSFTGEFHSIATALRDGLQVDM